MLFAALLVLNLTYPLVMAGPMKPLVIPIEYDADGLMWPDTETIDPTCGEHPLRSIVKKLENTQPNVDQDGVVRLLSLMKNKAPKLWSSYQAMLAAYRDCKLIASGGALG